VKIARALKSKVFKTKYKEAGQTYHDVPYDFYIGNLFYIIMSFVHLGL